MARETVFPRLALVLMAVVCPAGVLSGAEWPSPVKWQPDRRAVQSGLYIQPRPAAAKSRVSFTVTEPAGVRRRRWPVRGAVPLFRGELKDPTRIRLLDGGGKEVPVQGIATAYWPEKTVRFLCLDFLVDLKAGEKKTFTLEYGSAVPPAKVAAASAKAGSVKVSTGKIDLAFAAGREFLSVKWPGGRKAAVPVTGQAVVCGSEKGENPVPHPLTVDRIAVTERGAVQTTVHLVGHYGSDKAVAPNNTPGAWRYPASVFFRIYADTGHVYVQHTFGYNGDEYKHFVASYGLTVHTALAGGKFHYGGDGNRPAESPLGVRLNQFAHDQWTLSGKAAAKGKRFAGWGAVGQGKARVLVALREAWQNWPAAVRADANGDLTCEILGEKTGRGLDLRYCVPYSRNRYRAQVHNSHSMEVGRKLSAYYTNSVSIGVARGLRKIHELLLDFSDGKTPAADVGRAHQAPLVPWPGVKRFKQTKALGHIAVYDDPKWDFVKQYYTVMFSILPLIHETNGLYGWVDWGDVPMCDSPRDGRFRLRLEGGVGWSNGERALPPYLYHYAAGGGRQFLDLARAYVHHTIGIDTEHAGGEYKHGNYHRHDQVHWRERNPQTSRQSGYRGWHVYHWLTGDPEVRRLALSAGIDAQAYRHNMDLRAGTKNAVVKLGGNLSALHHLAGMCWMTTGDWRYARAHHAIAVVTERNRQQGRTFAWGTPITVVDGEPQKVELGKPGALAGYWLTYGGDDLLLDWASLTGDPAAVNAILLEGRLHTGQVASYHSPEALYLAMAYLDPKHPKLKGFLDRRLWMTPSLKRFRDRKLKAPAVFKSAEHWDGFGTALYGKNGFSILGAQGLEVLHTILALERLAGSTEREKP